MEYQLLTPSIPVDTNKLTLVERVFANRGIYPQNIEHYLNTNDKDIFPPSIIARIKDGAKMLIKHISQGDKVLLQIDSDCDGFTSSAVLLNYLNCLFPAFVRNNIYYRIHEGKQHGIILETVPEDVKLVIAPDSSSNDYEVHEALHNRGVDVLVIDHHEAKKISTYACIINNQLCNYPTKSLSGVGMVWKFCSLIDEYMNTNYADDFLDLVAVGMVADMMDLRDYETKHLITQGLSQIRNPYLKGMVSKNEYQIKGELNPFKVAFYIAPYVNATIRVGTQDEKLMLFESMLDYRGYELIPSTKRGCKGQSETRVEQACRNCSNIKNRQTKARDSSLDTIEHIIERKDLLKNKILVVKLINFSEKNLTGLIANQLMAKYQRPVLLLNKVINDDGVISWEGSGRAPGDMKIENFRDWLINTGLVMYAEGHASAFGVGILDDNFNEFINYTNQALRDFDFTPCYKVDEIIKENELSYNVNSILKIAELESVWGQGVEEPLVAIEGIKVNASNLKLMSPDKNPTLKITAPDGVSFIKFRSSNEEYDELYSELGCVTINIVGKCQRNIWNGNINPQIIIESYEIVGKTQYYF